MGTIYLPVQNISASSNWYKNNLDALISYQDEDKAIINFAGISCFLVKAKENEHNYFFDFQLNKRFPITFEVDGIDNLKELHHQLKQQGVKLGEIEDRGHPGNNFVFYDLDGNIFDVWSELSPTYKKE